MGQGILSKRFWVYLAAVSVGMRGIFGVKVREGCEGTEGKRPKEGGHDREMISAHGREIQESGGS